MTTSTVSVAMATYNGARHLPDQLESLLTQTRLPDEIVVCDDESTDETLRELEDFASRAPFPVRLHVNDQRLGPRRNFNQAIELCSGDLIALSDQDDVWLPSKLERLAEQFESRASLVVAVHDLALVDETLQTTGVTSLQRMQRLRIPATNHVTGSATAFRARIIPLLLPFPETVRIYDEWIHIVGRALGGRAVIPEVLSLYRRHEDTHTRAAVASWTYSGLIDAMRETLRRPSDVVDGRRVAWLLELQRRAGSEPGSRGPCDRKSVTAFIEQQHRAIDARKDVLRARWPKRWIRLVGAYRAGVYGEFAGPGSAIRDLLAPRLTV